MRTAGLVSRLALARACVPGRWRIAVHIAMVAALAMFVAGCEGPLPEKDSFAAQLYAARCDGCHHAYNPHRMTAAMWEVQVGMMEPKMREAGLPPLTPEERKTILDYLQRNAGQQ